MKLRNSFLLIAVIAQAVAAQQVTPTSNEWNGLVPLHSTRSDVERLLGSSKMSQGFASTYETKDNRIDILYSAGPCALSGVEKWNVPADVVISMQVNPKGTVQFGNLHLDAKKYSRFREAHPDNWVQYWNETDGIIVHTIFYGRNEELVTDATRNSISSSIDRRQIKRTCAVPDRCRQRTTNRWTRAAAACFAS